MSHARHSFAAILAVAFAAFLGIFGVLRLWASAAVTITDAQPGPKSYTHMFTASNPSGNASLTCNAAAPCDDTALTVTLPAGYVAAHPGAAVGVAVSWTDADPTGNSPKSDYDLYIYKGTSPGASADWLSAGTGNPEKAAIYPLVDGTSQYTVRVVPATSKGETVTVTIQLFPGTTGSTPGPCDSPIFGDADKPCAGNPRYQVFAAPPGSSAESSSQGEFNIGYNPHTGRIMTMNIGPIWRITPAEVKTGGGAPADSGLPEACPEVWDDVSDPSTDTGLDPILWTDQKSGRTFATNSTAGGASIYTDSDGGDPPAADQPSTAWLQGAQPPNGGADHETIGSGPFPGSLAALTTPQNQGEFLLFCSQDLAAPSQCQRSLTLGTSWDTPFPATGFGCAGLHGHVRVAPDGTAVLPVKQCSTGQGGSLSIDSSTSPWTEFVVQKAAADSDGPAFTAASQPNGADPSVGFDASSTIYYCYVNNEAGGNEGHVHVAVGKRQGTTTTIKWIRDTDVGKSHGIVNAAHTEAWAGDTGRAACGFLGTNVPGNFQAGNFQGDWYAFVATTYDEGRTWVTVNATPNDPVQRHTGVWQQGGSGDNGDRNLLDFNEITMDSKGRVLYGHSDGCVSPGCVEGTTGNDKTAYMRVARQIGGKTLLASADPAEPAAPKRACLLDPAWSKTSHPAFTASTRDPSTAHLHWRAPDNNADPVTGYQIFRGSARGTETLLASVSGSKTDYDDTTAGSTQPDWFYYIKAINSTGTSAAGNEVDLTITVPPPTENVCAVPGITILTDPPDPATEPGGNGTTPWYDIQKLSASEPYDPAGSYKIYFHLRMAGLSTVPANVEWPINFCAPAFSACTDTNAAISTTNLYFVAQMTTVPTDMVNPADTMEFQLVKPDATGATTTILAEPASNYTTDGLITIVVKASDLGLTTAGLGTDTLNTFLVRIRNNAGAVAETPDNMPDGVAGAGSFKPVGNAYCAPNAPPVVDTFTAAPTSGPSPLDVTFTVTAHDPDTANDATNQVASYTFNFGDGSLPVTQAAASVAHTYSSSGDFIARVTVTDSRGLASLNSATQEISVEADPRSLLQNNRLGGAMPFGALLVMGLLGTVVRRARRRR